MSDEPKRHLTDEDVEALAKAFRDEFYGALGRGVWALLWKAIVIAAVGIAAYGASKGVK